MQHMPELMRILQESGIDLIDIPEALEDLTKRYPQVGRAIIENQSLPNELKQMKVIDRFAKQSLIAIILGRRGGGKTSFAMWLAEQVHEWYPDLHIQAFNVNAAVPPWIERVQTTSQLQDDSLVIFDEAGKDLNARRSMASENVDMTELLTISRHKHLRLLYITQHTQILDKNVWRFMDVLFVKPLSWEERIAMGQRDDELSKFIYYLYPETPDTVLYGSEGEWFSFKYPLPSFWNDTLSENWSTGGSESIVDDVLVGLKEDENLLHEVAKMALLLYISSDTKRLRTLKRRILQKYNASETVVELVLNLTKQIVKQRKGVAPDEYPEVIEEIVNAAKEHIEAMKELARSK